MPAFEHVGIRSLFQRSMCEAEGLSECWHIGEGRMKETKMLTVNEGPKEGR